MFLWHRQSGEFLTFENIWDAAFEIDEGGILQHSVRFCYAEVFRLYKHDPVTITVVVNIFQLLEDTGAVGTPIRI